MGIRNIFFENNEILHKPCRTVTDFNERLWTLLDDLKDTMVSARAIGLAGPHIGVLKKIMVMQNEGKIIEIVNPEIIHKAGVQLEPEGSVSCPGERVITVRPMAVKVIGKNRFGKDIEIYGKGLVARILCHEIDQTNGIFFKKRDADILNRQIL